MSANNKFTVWHAGAILLVFSPLLLAFAFFIICPPERYEPTPAGHQVLREEFSGHQYLTFDFGSCASVVHDPDCPCSKPRKETTHALP